jgi:hypothetical protein
MRRLLDLLAMVSVIGLIGFFLWARHSAVSTQAATLPSATSQSDAQDDNQPQYPEQQQARGIVTIASPLAELMSRVRSGQETSNSETSNDDSGSRPSVSSEHVTDSPVGTGNPILHKTFQVAKAANLPFEIPPHAATPKLHGTYHAFFQHAAPSDSDGADIEFLLLNQQQYSDFINQRPGDALFSADEAHDQEVNITLPPTLNQPVKYYLVFRNGSSAGKIDVQADFRVDF